MNRALLIALAALLAGCGNPLTLEQVEYAKAYCKAHHGNPVLHTILPYGGIADVSCNIDGYSYPAPVHPSPINP